jgi:GTP cyclohydrolase I
MIDVQIGPAPIPLHINRVGVRGISMPMRVRQRGTDTHQHTVASVELSVDLPPTCKGTHMSRFVETVQRHAESGLDYNVSKKLMEDMREHLHAERAHAAFSFNYFLERKGPSTGISAIMHYACRLAGEVMPAPGRDPAWCSHHTLDVTVPVMTVCPCSKAISEQGAHSQRAYVHMSVRMRGWVWIEELIDIAEAAGSSPVYTLLKREDEKYVTEHAFAKPAFVEDVVRNVTAELSKNQNITHFRVEVESAESIHAHNAFACIESC